MKWISVKDRLPEIGTEVIVIAKSKRLFMQIWTKYDENYYSHWMPLPEPPEEK